MEEATDPKKRKGEGGEIPKQTGQEGLQTDAAKQETAQNNGHDEESGEPPVAAKTETDPNKTADAGEAETNTGTSSANSTDATGGANATTGGGGSSKQQQEQAVQKGIMQYQ